MSPSPEELLQEAVQLHQKSQFKKCVKAAENARKKFLKAGEVARAIEALRVMADCALNKRDYMKARKLYEQLLKEGSQRGDRRFQAAAHWGLGQIALHKMDYVSAVDAFKVGLELASSVADNWYMGWNALSLGNAQRGVGQLGEARTSLEQAVKSFSAMSQPTLAAWAERVLSEIGDEPSTGAPQDAKVWLCPLCGSKFSSNQASTLKRGKMVTCEYCGTSVG